MALQKTKRQLTNERNFQKIIENAQRLFAEYGYDTVTVDDICSASQVGKSTFYHLFSSKEDLLMAAACDERNLFLKQRYMPDDEISFPDQFRAFFQLNFAFNRERGADRTRLEYKSYLVTGSAIAAQDNPYVDFLYLLIDRGQREGYLSKTLSREEYFYLYTDVLIGCIIGWSVHKSEDFGLTPQSYDRIFDVLIENLLGGKKA